MVKYRVSRIAHCLLGPITLTSLNPSLGSHMSDALDEEATSAGSFANAVFREEVFLALLVSGLLVVLAQAARKLLDASLPFHVSRIF